MDGICFDPYLETWFVLTTTWQIGWMVFVLTSSDRFVRFPVDCSHPGIYRAI